MEGTAETRKNLVASIHLEPDQLEKHIRKLEAKYKRAEREAVRCEHFMTEGAEVVLVGYGIVARILKSVVSLARARGMKVGLLRPVTLYPFPTLAIRKLARTARVFACVEMSTGMMIEDVRLALEGLRPVEFYGRMGGNAPGCEEVFRFVEQLVRRCEPVMVGEEVFHG